VRDLPLAVLRRALGVSPQEPFLFSDTIAANVAFGLDVDANATEARARIADAARIAALDADVEAFPRGYDTVLGERGITLSGGQKQRVALARALAVDPRVLVLDDAVSAVDTATEEAILSRLRDVRRGRTCVIVAHRVSTVRDADEIVVLEAGRVVERGTHDALVARDGYYAAMHRRQLLEQEIASA
jgi:ATP-binding cassette subfamily B protein